MRESTFSSLAPRTSHLSYGTCGATSWVRSHRPVVGWSGSGGGVIQDGLLKSKNSVMSSAAASRAVRGCTPNRVSINFRIEMNVRGVCDTKFFFAQGDTTITGVRKPE